MAQPMDVAKFALAAENLLRPLAAEAQRPWERTQKLNDLSNVIIVFAVFGPGLGVEQIVACDEFKDLCMCKSNVSHLGACMHAMPQHRYTERPHTIAAMLHTSVLAPHFEPRMTSGDRYWRVWISLVK